MYSVQASILGIIQGITEFLPVSSSGHIILIPELFGWSDQGLGFDVVVHLGTLLAVIVFFRKKLFQIITGFITGHSKRFSKPRQLGWLLILATIPAGLAGIFLQDFVESTLRSPLVVAVSLILWGVVLGIADRYGENSQDRKIEELNWKHVLFIGCAQAIALIPGTSRSGITMTAGLFCKLDKTEAAEFSFLMSVPIIGSAGVLKLSQLINSGLIERSLEFLIIGFVVSAISGFVAIWLLMGLIKKWNYLPFAVYRVVIALVIFMVI